MGTKKNNIWRLIKYITTLTASIFVITTCAILLFGNMRQNDASKYSYEVYRSRIEIAMGGCKDSIVSEIDSYINKIAPSSSLNGVMLFTLCDEYDIDVRFAMAQGEIESHFGTAGVAAKTNSVWNVKAYDGRSADDMNASGDGFSHPDHSIEPYLQLLKKSYLVNGKTEEDMFVNFVSSSGHRYASSKTYEVAMLSTFNKINDKTKLDELLVKYKHYKMIINN